MVALNQHCASTDSRGTSRWTMVAASCSRVQRYPLHSSLNSRSRTSASCFVQK